MHVYGHDPEHVYVLFIRSRACLCFVLLLKYIKINTLIHVEQLGSFPSLVKRATDQLILANQMN